MIKVFKVPSGKRQYMPLYRQIQDSGVWQILDVKKSELTGEWFLRCINKEFFFDLNHDTQVRVAKGIRASNY